MIYIKHALIPRGIFESSDDAELGKYYAITTHRGEKCFVHILEMDPDICRVGMIALRLTDYSFARPVFKKKEITPSIFQQAIEFFERCERSIHPLKSERNSDCSEMEEGHFYNFQDLSNDSGSIIRLGYVDNYGIRGIGLESLKNTLEFYEFRLTFQEMSIYGDKLPKFQCFEIEPKTYKKLQKIYDMFYQSLSTLIMSYLE